jgi:hypothetical protein
VRLRIFSPLGFVISFIFFLCHEAWAGDSLRKIQFFQVNYGGNNYETFSPENPGVGGEVIVSTDKDRFNWIAKGRFTTINGSQKFDDSGAKITSDFTFYQAAFEGGFSIYPFKRAKKTINLYFGSTVFVSFNHLSLASTSLTTVQESYSATGKGVTALAGAEWNLFGNSNWCLTAEFSQRNESLALAGKSSFSLGGFSISAGMGW